jgi:hypothetical protein
VDYSEIRELQSFGLLVSGSFREINRVPHGIRSSLRYRDRLFEFSRVDEPGRSVEFERLRLTASGVELARVASDGDEAYLSDLFRYLQEAGSIEARELPSVGG